MAKIRAVLKHPNKKPVVMLVDNSIDAMEKQVEGTICSAPVLTWPSSWQQIPLSSLTERILVKSRKMV